MPRPSKPRIFVDADVIFAGSAAPSEYGASLVVLRLGEITLIECVTSEQAMTAVERNLAAKIPAKLAAFRQPCQPLPPGCVRPISRRNGLVPRARRS